MIGFYALGGGFGHLTRVSTFIQNQNIKPPFKIITNNSNASRFFKPKEVILLEEDEIELKEILENSIQNILAQYSFTEFYIDIFPTGILGELSASIFKNAKTYLLARRLKWDSYRQYLNEKYLIHFEKTFAFEPLEEEHLGFIYKYSKAIISTKLDYSNVYSTRLKTKIEAFEKPIWLIVHTSNQEELEILWQQAQDVAAIENIQPQWVILSDQKLNLPNHIKSFQHENPSEWFPHSEKIFSAAGFNTIHQLIPHASKCEVLPFQRRFDDQFWRAKNFREHFMN